VNRSRRVRTLAVLPVLISALSLGLSSPAAIAAVYYVSPTGNDANDGSSGHPWGTLGYAFAQLRSRDTLRLLDGVHMPTNTPKLQATASGTADAWTTVEAVPGASPVVDFGPVEGQWVGMDIRADYVKIRDIEFRDANERVIYTGYEQHHLLIENCKFRNFWECLRMNGTDATIRNNEFWQEYARRDMDQPGFTSCRSQRVVFEGNVFCRTRNVSRWDRGLTFKGAARDIVIRHNVFIGDPDAPVPSNAIVVGGLLAPKTDTEWESVNVVAHDNLFVNWPGSALIFWHARDCGAYNNTVYAPNLDMPVLGVVPVRYAIDDPIHYHNPKNITLRNNILVAGRTTRFNSSGVMNVGEGCAEGFVSDNNLWYSTADTVKIKWAGELKEFADYVAQTEHDTHSLVAEPRFLDPANGNYHLQPDGTAIDAGYALTFGWLDLDGRSRPLGDGFDIGCYEMPRENTPPAPVTTLNAQDTPNDDGGSIDLDWSGYAPPGDLDHYNIYRATSPFDAVTGFSAIAQVSGAPATSYADATTTDGTGYYYAVTAVDMAGAENKNVQSVSPVQSVNNGSLAPTPIAALTAADTPGDAGGSIRLDWTGYNPPADFDHYNVYRSTSSFSDVSDLTLIATVDDASQTTYTDATTTDGTDYYYAVTCVDTDGKENTAVASAGPVQSVNDTAMPPDPVATLSAHDTPGDSGGSIDLDWSGYSAPADSGHYNIYRATASFSNVSEMEPIATVDDASQTTYSDATTTDGTDYYYAVTCVDTDGKENTAVASVGPVQSMSNGASGSLQSHDFAAGKQLVTMPATPADTDLSASQIWSMGPDQIHRWDAAGQPQQWVCLRDHPDDALFAVRPGAGFCVSFPVPTTVSFDGEGVSTHVPFEIDVRQGWNLLGNPWPIAMPWSSLSPSRQGSSDGSGWIYEQGQGTAYDGYTLVSSREAFRAARSVPAYHAFWIDASTDAEKLIIGPPGAQSSARSITEPIIRWFVPIIVTAGGKRDAYNGVGAAAADLFIGNPPAATGAVDAFLTARNNPGARAAYELRSATEGQTFDLTVVTDLPDTDVTVAMPDMSQLPRGYRVTLRDLDTGKLIHMRTAGAYTYNSGATGGERRFEVEVAPASGGTLTITGISVAPSRGNGAEIWYNISDAAAVSTRIYNVAGRLVTSLERGRSVSRGRVSSVWDGRSVMGTVAPSGTYVLEIVAVTDDGQRARAIHPLVVRR